MKFVKGGAAGLTLSQSRREYFAPGERFEADYILPDGISLGETAEGIPAFYNAAGTHFCQRKSFDTLPFSHLLRAPQPYRNPSIEPRIYKQYRDNSQFKR